MCLVMRVRLREYVVMRVRLCVHVPSYACAAACMTQQRVCICHYACACEMYARVHVIMRVRLREYVVMRVRLCVHVPSNACAPLRA